MQEVRPRGQTRPSKWLICCSVLHLQDNIYDFVHFIANNFVDNICMQPRAVFSYLSIIKSENYLAIDWSRYEYFDQSIIISILV